MYWKRCIWVVCYVADVRGNCHNFIIFHQKNWLRCVCVCVCFVISVWRLYSSLCFAYALCFSFLFIAFSFYNIFKYKYYYHWVSVLFWSIVLLFYVYRLIYMGTVKKLRSGGMFIHIVCALPVWLKALSATQVWTEQFFLHSKSWGWGAKLKVAKVTPGKAIFYIAHHWLIW